MHLTRSILSLSVMGATIAGCSGETGPELIPVMGRVMIDGKRANEGAVTYRHATSGAFEASGLIQPDGTYTLLQDDREGAQAGPYRVVVFVMNTPKTPSGELAGLPRIIVNQKFTNPDTTPLSVDVEKDAAPGHYDLKVTR